MRHREGRRRPGLLGIAVRQGRPGRLDLLRIHQAYPRGAALPGAVQLRSVREALAEREVLWKSAPHLIRPMRFVLPHHRGLRPAWMLRLGLALYDRIGGRTRLAGARAVDLAQDPAGRPLKPQFRKGFEYSDCTVDDSRLVVMNARDAVDRGAVIKTRTKLKRARSREGVWEIVTQDTLTDVEEVTTARLIVNATGPWADLTLAASSQNAPARSIRLVQGSHIVVPRLFDHERSYLFQGSDRRVVFAIPYQQCYTLIGTTDVDYQGDPADTAVQPQEVSYLCGAVNRYLERPVREDDVVWSYSGLRPIYDDGADAAQDASRDYVLRQHREAGGAPLVNVFGGKITTYRRLAEDAMKLIELHLGRRVRPGPRAPSFQAETSTRTASTTCWRRDRRAIRSWRERKWSACCAPTVR